MESKTQGLTPWPDLLAQVDALAARLVELQPPRLRIDLDARAVGYRSLEGLTLEGVASLLGQMLEVLARTYPCTEGPVQIIGLWPGTPTRPARWEVLAEVLAEVVTI